MPNDPRHPRFQTPEGYKPPTKAGTKTEVGKGNQVAPRKEGESEESYLRRKANWERSYALRGGVRIADMNQGQLNRFAASGGQRRANMITSRIGQYMENQAKQQQNQNQNPPSGGGGNNNDNKPRGEDYDPPRGGGPHNEAMGAGPSSSRGMTGGTGAMAGLSQMPGSARRRKTQRIRAKVAERSRY